MNANQSNNCAIRSMADASGRRSRVMSVIEAVANGIAGLLVALLGQQVFLPLFGVHLTIAAHAGLAALFTLLSLMRAFLMRRLFDHVDHVHRAAEMARQARLRRALSHGGT